MTPQDIMSTARSNIVAERQKQYIKSLSARGIGATPSTLSKTATKTNKLSSKASQSIRQQLSSSPKYENVWLHIALFNQPSTANPPARADSMRNLRQTENQQANSSIPRTNSFNATFGLVGRSTRRQSLNTGRGSLLILDDDRLARTKVVQKRLEKAATTIQAFYRYIAVILRNHRDEINSVKDEKRDIEHRRVEELANIARYVEEEKQKLQAVFEQEMDNDAPVNQSRQEIEAVKQSIAVEKEEYECLLSNMQRQAEDGDRLTNHREIEKVARLNGLDSEVKELQRKIQLFEGMARENASERLVYKKFVDRIVILKGLQVNRELLFEVQQIVDSKQISTNIRNRCQDVPAKSARTLSIHEASQPITLSQSEPKRESNQETEPVADFEVSAVSSGSDTEFTRANVEANCKETKVESKCKESLIPSEDTQTPVLAISARQVDEAKIKSTVGIVQIEEATITVVREKSEADAIESMSVAQEPRRRGLQRMDSMPLPTACKAHTNATTDAPTMNWSKKRRGLKRMDSMPLAASSDVQRKDLTVEAPAMNWSQNRRSLKRMDSMPLLAANNDATNYEALQTKRSQPFRDRKGRGMKRMDSMPMPKKSKATSKATEGPQMDWTKPQQKRKPPIHSKSMPLLKEEYHSGSQNCENSISRELKRATSHSSTKVFRKASFKRIANSIPTMNWASMPSIDWNKSNDSIPSMNWETMGQDHNSTAKRAVKRKSKLQRASLTAEPVMDWAKLAPIGIKKGKLPPLISDTALMKIVVEE